MTVDIRFLPGAMNDAYILYDGKSYPLVCTDKVANSKTKRNKQLLKENDSFLSSDHKTMMDRLNYLKDIRGIGVFTASPGMGKSYALDLGTQMQRQVLDAEVLMLAIEAQSLF